MSYVHFHIGSLAVDQMLGRLVESELYCRVTMGVPEDGPHFSVDPKSLPIILNFEFRLWSVVDVNLIFTGGVIFWGCGKILVNVDWGLGVSTAGSFW